MIVRRRLGLVAALLLAAACRRADDGGAGNLQSSPATPVALAKPVPPPLPPEQALAAAFAVAFPQGGEVGEGDRQMQFVARDLAPLRGGRLVAVLANGTGVGLNTCHACTGELRITYVQRQGTGFAPLSPPIRRSIAGDGFGGPPDWKLDTTGPEPIVHVSTGFTGQGCTVTRETTWALRPDGVRATGKGAVSSEEGC